MKKRILPLLLAALMAFGLTVGASAALLGDGVGVLAKETTMVKGAIAGSTVRFSATDFKQAMGLRRFEAITVTSLPDGKLGVLYFGKEPLTVGISVPRESLDSLCFVPKDDKVKEAGFTFTCESYAGGAELACTIRFAESLNHAPTVSDVAASRTVSTYSGMRAEGTLCATDPEGDAVEFIVIEYPLHGVLTVTDTAYGDFCYTPTAGYTGKDEFTFVVRDLYGNYSRPATVEVTVKERESTLDYRDLPVSSAWLPALVLAEENIMPGTLIGDGMYFSPTAKVSRGDFLVMAMKAAGITPRAGLYNTVFDDNESISEGIRPYVATAQERGYIIGTLSDEGLVFLPDETLERGEAATILARILGAEIPAGAIISAGDEGIPAAYRTPTLALLSMGIYPRDAAGALSTEEPLDRAAASEMLYATLLASK